MEGSRTGRIVVLIIMDLIIVVAVLLTARVLVEFFGTLASQSWAEALVRLTDPIAGFGIGADVKTPYGGVFDLAATTVILALLLIEWVLSLVKSRL
ncbi:MAG: hypothetical protein HY876_08855 [Coriobacteriales bacterium]|nr:hypothetical protein [Coriobacteriales bacterium]